MTKISNSILRRAISDSHRRARKSEIEYYPFIWATENILFGDIKYSIVPVTAQLLSYRGGYCPTNACAEIANWFRQNKATSKGFILHEPYGSIDSVNHRFYFTDSAQATRFGEWINGQRSPNSNFYGNCVFRNFGSEVVFRDKEPFSSTALGGVVKYNVPSENSYATMGLLFWCTDNLKGSVYRTDDMLIFEKFDDLVLFKMQFQENEDTLRFFNIADINSSLFEGVDDDDDDPGYDGDDDDYDMPF